MFVVFARLYFVNGEWTYADIDPRELLITNPDGTKSPIKQEEVMV
jgi:hypothetical protein